MVRVAIYARVSSDRQAQDQTIDSQVTALRERVARDGHTLDDALCFLDDGISGSTLRRAALEQLRDLAYVGGFQTQERGQVQLELDLSPFFCPP